jgi:hypothetical protein
MDKLLNPIKAFRLRYLPLLMVYFTRGFIGLTAVTATYFMKDQISLSAAKLISLGIWTGLPWSIKIVFGSVIDGISLFGNHRKSYIYLGNFLILLGTLGMVDHASTHILFNHLGQFGGLLITGLLATTGTVVAGIIASTMAIELVDPAGDVQKELGEIQVLTQIALAIGSLGAAAITGFLAAHYSTAVVFGLAAVCPVISIISTAVVRLNKPTHESVFNRTLIIAGGIYAVVCVLCGLYLAGYAQPVIFALSFTVISSLMYWITKSMPKDIRIKFFISMIAIFLFRTTPGAGPGLSWFYINKMGFDQEFLGLLSLTGAISSLAILWFFMDYMASANIPKVLTWLTVLGTILSLPDIMVFYHINDLLHISARHLILVDTAAGTAIAELSMIPLGVIIAKNAPPEQRAIYISLTASLMNLALVCGDLLTKALNNWFVVTREDFSQLGQLLIWSLIISTALSILGLIVLKVSELRKA